MKSVFTVLTMSLFLNSAMADSSPTMGLSIGAIAPLSSPLASLMMPANAPQKAMTEAETDAAIGRVVSSGMRQFKQCYNSRLKENEGLQGTWTFSMSGSADGSIDSVAFQANGDSDEQLEDCLQRQTTRWEFPTMSEGVELEQVLKFAQAY